MSKSLPPCSDNFTKAANDGQYPANDQGFIKMPKTANGKPRFTSRSDGAEAGMVSGGYNGVGPKVI
ncbi:MAG: hypothetical protein CMH27_03285 [Micavibrio sp.]|nr:hypothetical protein [Micavibrio sp.]|tara:strand:+ start:3171 stop:3368 length:198 start_codon:yes stop_codon:yes gene_type:complete